MNFRSRRKNERNASSGSASAASAIRNGPVDENIIGQAALADPLEAFRSFFLDDRKFIGGDEPSIADLLAGWPTLSEFLCAIDYDFPAWTEDYMRRVEEALGEAYTEPAQDVRGYIASVKPAEQPAS